MSTIAHMELEKVKGLFQHDLRDDEYLSCLKGKYINLLVSNFGPKGKSTLIQTSGGHNVLTSSSSLLLQQLSFLHPSFKYMNALIGSQNRSYGVHGLYVGLLCSKLLYRVVRLEETVPFPVISEVSLWIIEEFMHRLERYHKCMTLQLDLGNVSALLNFVRSILSSKGHYLLSSDEIKHISIKIVEGYLKTFPTDAKCGFSHIHITTLEGPSCLQTRLFEGLLYREANYSYRDLRYILGKLPKGDLKVLLLNIPLSHEASPKTEVVEWLGENSSEFVFNELFSTLFKKCLKEKDIHVLANQKFIHPMVKLELEREGILVLERLGTSLSQSLMQISGCVPVAQLANLDSEVNEDTLGHLSHIDAVVIEEKIFLNLRSIRASQNSTLLLSGINCHIVEYLKETVGSCISLLRLAAQDPTMIIGGGCLEAFFSCIISEMKKNASSLAAQFGANTSEVSKVFDEFINVFLHLAVVTKGGRDTTMVDFSVDSSHWHLWQLPAPMHEEEKRIEVAMQTPTVKCENPSGATGVTKPELSDEPSSVNAEPVEQNSDKLPDESVNNDTVNNEEIDSQPSNDSYGDELRDLLSEATKCVEQRAAKLTAISDTSDTKIEECPPSSTSYGTELRSILSDATKCVEQNSAKDVKSVTNGEDNSSTYQSNSSGYESELRDLLSEATKCVEQRAAKLAAESTNDTAVKDEDYQICSNNYETELRDLLSEATKCVEQRAAKLSDKSIIESVVGKVQHRQSSGNKYGAESVCAKVESLVFESSAPNHFTPDPDRCSCRTYFKRELEPSVSFFPLLSLRDDSPFEKNILSTSAATYSESKKSIETNWNKVTNCALPPDNEVPWRETCILDYFSAKRNALRLAFEGFSELHQIGMCIFDK